MTLSGGASADIGVVFCRGVLIETARNQIRTDYSSLIDVACVFPMCFDTYRDAGRFFRMHIRRAKCYFWTFANLVLHSK